MSTERRTALHRVQVAVPAGAPLPGYESFCVDDPIGNRGELLQPVV